MSKILATHTYNQRNGTKSLPVTKRCITKTCFKNYLLNTMATFSMLFSICSGPPRKCMHESFTMLCMQGLGTNERALIEMSASLERHELRRVNGAYIGMYEKMLESDIKGDTSGFFRDLLVELIKGREADNSPNSMELPRYTVATLNTLGYGQWSNNKDTIRDIFCKKSFYELSEILVEYERQNGHKIDEDIETEFSGDVKKTLLAIGK
ncbi:hypothetical protein HA402_000620 [Bradysia odoriphaga]|nr:hypothetical protein HA402_000620 [Bradysia odoriphaga]